MQCIIGMNLQIQTASGNEQTHLFVALAPYCLPLLTLICVIARVMIKTEWIWLYDMIIGLKMFIIIQERNDNKTVKGRIQ